MEEKLKNLENNLISEENSKLYKHYRNELETIYDNITNSIKIWSKCEWCEHGENSTKFFFNLERTRGVRNRMRKLIVEVKEITQRNIQKLQSIL